MKATFVWLRSLGVRRFVAALIDGYRIDRDGRFTRGPR